MKTKRTYMTLAATAILFSFTVSAQTAPSDPLQPLRDLLGDEQAAMEALDRYDSIQQGLIEWDLAMAQDLTIQGDEEAAKIKTADAEHRLQSIRQAYLLMLEAYPRNAVVMNAYGELMFHRFHDASAGVMYWKKAASSGEDEPLSRANLASYFGHSGNYELMMNYLDEALEIDDKNPDVLFYAVQIYLVHYPQVGQIKEWDKQKVFNKAMEMSRKAAEAVPSDHQLQEDYAVNFYAGENMNVKVDWKEASEAWLQTQKVAFTADDKFFAWLNHARVNTMIGNWDVALASVKEALKIHPDNDTAKRVRKMIKNQEPMFRGKSS